MNMDSFSLLVGPTKGQAESEEEVENDGAKKKFQGGTNDVERCPHLHFM